MTMNQREYSQATSIQAGAHSDTGPVRSENEDTYGRFIAPDGANRLFIVADGMGGHSRGRKASTTALQVIKRVFFETQEETLEGRLRNAFHQANERVYHLAQADEEQPADKKMGTTCTALAVAEDMMVVGHVGDSRLYRFDAHHIEQVTRDHTLVANLVAEGVLTKEQARSHPQRHVLARALGVKSTLEVDLFHPDPPHDGEGFLLCSDGLVGLSDEKIHRLALADSPQQASEHLVEEAKREGGLDNVTALLIRFDEA